MRYAVLDLGSNTFHLLIVEVEDAGQLKTIYRERQYVKLSSGGIENIESSAYHRALKCLGKFREKMNEYAVIKSRAFGTATIRSAKNGRQFVEEVETKYGITILAISGQEEARLITKGVLQATHLSPNPYLIMDIGGGSVEFIVVANNEVKWSESYNVGISILKNKFHHHDPMRKEEIDALRAYLDMAVPILKEIHIKYGPFNALIGASGSFEVLQAILHPPLQEPAFYQFPSSSMKSIAHEILQLNHDQRVNHPLIPKERADLIVVALILMEYVLDQAQIEEIIVSEYALKEGAIMEMIQESM